MESCEVIGRKGWQIIDLVLLLPHPLLSALLLLLVLQSTLLNAEISSSMEEGDIPELSGTTTEVPLSLLATATLGHHPLNDDMWASNTKQHELHYDGKALELRLGEDAGLQLYQHWMEQAYSGLFAALANKRLEKASQHTRYELTRCSASAETVIAHAQCLTALLDSTPGVAKRKRNRKRRSKRTIPSKPNPSNNSPSVAAEPKLVVAQRSNYSLGHSGAGGGGVNGLSPMGVVAKMLRKALLGARNKPSEEATNWQTTVERLRRVGAAEKQIRKENSANEKSDSNRVAKDPEAHKDSKNSPQSKSTRQLVGLLREGVRLGMTLAGQDTHDFDNKTLKLLSPKFFSVGEPPDEQERNETISLLSPSLLAMEEDGGADELERRLSLPALTRDYFTGRDQQEWLNLIVEAAGVNDIAAAMLEQKKPATSTLKGGESSSPSTSNSSPNMQQRQHVNTSGEVGSNAMPHPASILDSVMKSALLGRSKGDGELDLDDANENYYGNKFRGADGQPLYFTKENVTQRYGDYEKRKIDTWEELLRTLSRKQLRTLNSTGYAVLTMRQRHQLYGPHSPYNHSSALERLAPYRTTSEVQEGMERDLRLLSEARSFELGRQRDITLSPIFFSPLIEAAPKTNTFIVLSPLVFSPLILTPAVLGPIILSPWVFVPLILSPRVASPFVLTPMIFSPVVLSPLVLHPFILSPGIFNPVILSPLLLSPLILSPQVFTPIILSPLLLNPLILNPMVGSPLVLSPFLLSPLILSPQLLFALVLSPYALSPLVESPLSISTLVLSPSFLS